MRTPNSPEVVSVQATRVLVAVVKVYRERGRVTVRDVCAEAGLASSSTVHHHLVELKHLGLVTWDEGRRCTLRPQVLPVLLATGT